MWSYEDTKLQDTPHVLHGGKTSNGSDVWQSFCFVVVRRMPTCAGEEPTVAVTIKSPYLRAACQDVIGEIEGISWTADPLEVRVALLSYCTAAPNPFLIAASSRSVDPSIPQARKVPPRI